MGLAAGERRLRGGAFLRRKAGGGGGVIQGAAHAVYGIEADVAVRRGGVRRRTRILGLVDDWKLRKRKVQPRRRRIHGATGGVDRIEVDGELHRR